MKFYVAFLMALSVCLPGAKETLLKFLCNHSQVWAFFWRLAPPGSGSNSGVRVPKFCHLPTYLNFSHPYGHREYTELCHASTLCMMCPETKKTGPSDFAEN